ncbi:energy transducer TonB [Thermomonas fusca]|uniref:Energy transducer TonB n=1 Tax=Thermomonas fusca TaxID=215690 RepID=A0A5R9PHF3_9GAMM|nr:energy transducer TonB [Thermomonas fusca]TLX22178.1 energy transducer TonB [Thermomonas fusca]
MSASDPQLPQRKPLLPPQLAIRLAIAFGVGLLLFLLVWLNSRRNYDFYKADGTEAAAGQSDALPVPLPPDLAGSDGGDGNASGLRTVGRDGVTDPAAVPASDQPRIIDAPVRPAPPPVAQAAPAPGDRAQPQPLSTPAPRYPREALRMGAGGTVRITVTVAADGSVERQELTDSSGNRHLDRAALETVRRWRFQPATRNGKPVAAEVSVPIVFNPDPN